MKILLAFFLLISAYSQNIRIKSIQILDEGQLTSDFAYLIDTKRTQCKAEDGEVKNEKFYDTLVQVEVVNDLPFRVMFTDFQIKLTNYNKKTFKSARRALVGNLEAPTKATTKFYGFLTKTTLNGKKLINQKEQIPESLGVRNIEYTLFYKIDKKRGGKVSARSAARFAEIDRCDR